MKDSIHRRSTLCDNDYLSCLPTRCDPCRLLPVENRCCHVAAPSCEVGCCNKPVGCSTGNTCSSSWFSCCFPKIQDSCMCGLGCCQSGFSSEENCLTMQMCGLCDTFVSGNGTVTRRENWTMSVLSDANPLKTQYDVEESPKQNKTEFSSYPCVGAACHGISCRRRCIPQTVPDNHDDTLKHLSAASHEHHCTGDQGECGTLKSSTTLEGVDASLHTDEIEYPVLPTGAPTNINSDSASKTQNRILLKKEKHAQIKWSIEERFVDLNGRTISKKLVFPGAEHLSDELIDAILPSLAEHEFKVNQSELQELFKRFTVEAITDNPVGLEEASVVAQIILD